MLTSKSIKLFQSVIQLDKQGTLTNQAVSPL